MTRVDIITCANTVKPISNDKNNNTSDKIITPSNTITLEQEERSCIHRVRVDQRARLNICKCKCSLVKVLFDKFTTHNTWYLLFIRAMVLGGVLLLTQVMVLYVIPCYGESLCYGVSLWCGANLCYGVDPCYSVMLLTLVYPSVLWSGIMVITQVMVLACVVVLARVIMLAQGWGWSFSVVVLQSKKKRNVWYNTML